MCWCCGTNLTVPIKLFRTDLCESCGRDLRVCKNCHFYSPGSHWDCSETIPESVTNKEKATFCDYFRYENKTINGASVSTKDTEAKSAFDALFSKGSDS